MSENYRNYFPTVELCLVHSPPPLILSFYDVLWAIWIFLWAFFLRLGTLLVNTTYLKMVVIMLHAVQEIIFECFIYRCWLAERGTNKCNYNNINCFKSALTDVKFRSRNLVLRNHSVKSIIPAYFFSTLLKRCAGRKDGDIFFME